MSNLYALVLTMLLGASVTTGSISFDGVTAGPMPSSTPWTLDLGVDLSATPAPTVAPTRTARPSSGSGSSSGSSTKYINTGTAITRELQKGASGSDVALLQTWLANLGYNVTPDGVFGQKTYNAVCRFQQNNGLAVDGIAA